MKLQTKIPLAAVKNQLGYDDSLLLLGSCFAQNIGEKLAYYKFQSVTNPFGIIFNPVSLEQLVQEAVENKTYTEEDVFEFDGIWKSYSAHSNLNGLTRLEAVIKLQEAQQELRNQLQNATHIFITLGTAWVYRHIESTRVVANCHKVPQKNFSKEILEVDEIVASLSNLINSVRSLNSQAHIVCTVSPVRHLKDGVIENMQSKSYLIAAVHQVVKAQKVAYFPAYELMMDELRDYRFYASDMLHPSEQAIDYIWERFVEVYAFAKAKETLKKVASIQKRIAHRPFNPESEKYKEFVTQLNKDVLLLKKAYPLINF